MKREKDLYQKIVAPSTLEVALHYASLGKKKRKSVQRILLNKENKLNYLKNLLDNETYHTFPYSKKVIIDQCTCKLREIYIPRFYPDQVVQWALMLVIKPIIMRGMYDYCCASIDGRGSSYGVNTVKRWIEKDKKNTKYCLICDVKKFYPSIDQTILSKKFERKIKDSKTLNLINKIIFSIPQGLPIGNFTSQWFANFYLQDFDHFVKEKLKIKYYIRYMDDMVFFSSNKRKLSKQKNEIVNFLTKEKLTLKSNWQIFKIADDKESGRPLDFLGYKFYRNYVTMRSRTFLRLKRRITKISKKHYLTAKDSSAVISYNARAKATSGNKLYNTYIRPYINIRKCRWTVSNHDRKQAKANKYNAHE